MSGIVITNDDQILGKDVLNRHYFEPFKRGEKTLEIFLTGACKANCDYCYLKKYQKSLYPSKLLNNELIIKNFQAILNWYVKNEFKCVIDIFSAEWITTPIADSIFDCIYNTFSKISPDKRPPAIQAADNMQFLKDEQLTQKVENYIEKLKSINIHLDLSASIDGKYCDYGRTENDDEYYDKLKNFLIKYNIKLHPMISADNTKYWIDNYLWFRKTFPDSIAKEIMTLEVRNSAWNEESIQQLLQYLDFLVDYKFNEFNQNKKEFLKYILSLFTQEERYNYAPYNIISLQSQGVLSNNDKSSCSIGNNFTIRVGDLSLAPCHRLYYPELEMGKFIVDDNNEIIDFSVTNPGLLIGALKIKKSCLPHCENCKFNDICIGFCHGASYEEYTHMLIPQIEVCKMFQSKFTFLIYKYYSMGLFDYLEELKNDLTNENYLYLTDLITSIIGGFINER